MTQRTEPSWPVRIGLLLIPFAILAVIAAARESQLPKDHVVADIGSQAYALTVAKTAAQQQNGLQGLPEPEPAEGMLFEFDPPRPVTMVIRSLTYPIDVVFVGDDRRVVRTVSMQPWPMGIQSAPSGYDVRYAIEVRKGALATGDIVPGDLFRLDSE